MIDYSVLKTEIETDPKALGYAGKSDEEIAALLNTVGLSSETLDRHMIDASEAQREVVASEYLSLSPGQQNLWNAIVSAGAGMIDISSDNTKQQVKDIWAPGTTTRSNLVALTTRKCSRAEALFGSDVGITYLDVGRALRW